MKIQKTVYAYVLACLFALCVYICYAAENVLPSRITFTDVDLNGSDGLLFSCALTEKSGTHKNLYTVRLSSDKNAVQAAQGEPELLTCFPQKLDSFQNGNFLQVRNSDGVFIYSAAKASLERVAYNPVLKPSPFVSARSRGILTETALSPDGNWICFFKKTEIARAQLVLGDTKTGQEYLLSEQCDFDFTGPRVLWSPDSKFLVYEKNDHLYFIEPKKAFSEPFLEDRFRSIGEGNIACVRWASHKKLMYVQKDSVFTVSADELYTRSLYAAVLGNGDLCGHLPWAFNGKQDLFWIDETGEHIVVVQNKKNVFYFKLESSSYPHNMAFLPVNGTAAAFYVMWLNVHQANSGLSENSVSSALDPSGARAADERVPVLWIDFFTQNEEKESRAYLLNTRFTAASDNGRQPYFTPVELPAGAKNPVLSPDGSNIAFIAGGALYVYDCNTYKKQAVYSAERIVSFAWRSNFSLYVGGSETVRLWDFKADTADILFLSSVNRFAWDEDGTGVLASVSAGTFIYDKERGTWRVFSSAIPRENVSLNAYRRIMSDKRENGPYANVLYVRSLQGLGKTLPLFTSFVSERRPQKRVAVAFDALDDRSGVPYILDTLSRYGLSATFFINGEFIRRFPDTVCTICNKGHECASMFYTAADLLSADFASDESFIRRGLARNEDEFYALTGEEMKLFWHAPYGRYSAEIDEAGKAAGYKMPENIISLLYNEKDSSSPSFSKVIENTVAQLKDGSVILVSCSAEPAQNGGDMYTKLDVLLYALLEAGCTPMPVSSFMY